ncbi:MAG TPA: alpha/beta fold hydrolase [Tepidisphaeraceae bacterium]|jgi:pimeloyl-ACP methyl ester carboxylesterase
MRRFVLTPLLALFSLVSVARAESHSATFRLEDGRLRSDEAMITLFEKLHLPGVGWGSYTVNLSSLEGSNFVTAVNESLGQGAHIDVNQKALTLSVDPQKLPRNCDSAKHAARVFTENIAPKAYAEQKLLWGLSLPKTIDERRRMVVLVHGLDCNKSNWWSMADLLGKEGYQVAYFTYPSDGPIEESVNLLADEMRALRAKHPNVPLSMIAHSMGGLVARAYVEGERYVGNVNHLIMLGTPNQGSKWAAYRVGLEMREHYELWKSEPKWRLSWMITDGLGEAGRDLKPSSKFLTELNYQPRRAGVHYTIVAGNYNMARRYEADVLDGTANVIPRRARSWWGLRQITSGLHHVADNARQRTGRSDGPVLVKSTQLQGVNDFVLIKADHNSLYIPMDGQEPLAWPTIRDRLAMANR